MPPAQNRKDRPRYTIEDVLGRLHGVKARSVPNQWDALCPAHEDHNRSLSIALGEDQRILVHCHRGCMLAAILEELGITEADLFPEEEKRNGKHASNGHRHIVATYDYRDLNGKLLFQVVRYEPKGFAQRRPDGNGGWTWGLGNTPRVLYRLSDLSQAYEDPIWIVEGEKTRIGLQAWA